MSRIRSLNSTKHLINSVEWTFVLLSDNVYKAKMGKDSSAICIFDKKTVYFCKSDFSIRTILHELIHCLVETHNLTSSQLDSDQFEEFMCELLANYYYKLGLWADEIFDRLHK